jgi:hypothetical protein
VVADIAICADVYDEGFAFDMFAEGFFVRWDTSIGHVENIRASGLSLLRCSILSFIL